MWLARYVTMSGRRELLGSFSLGSMANAMPQALGPVYGPRLLDVLGAAPAEVFALVRRHAIACEAVARGTLHCAVGAAGLAEITERARQWAALGAPVEVETLAYRPLRRAVLAASSKRAATSSIVHSVMVRSSIQAIANTTQQFTFNPIETIVISGHDENVLVAPATFLDGVQILNVWLQPAERAAVTRCRNLHLTPPVPVRAAR